MTKDIEAVDVRLTESCMVRHYWCQDRQHDWMDYPAGAPIQRGCRQCDAYQNWDDA